MRIAITGGIGSGKSTVLDFFAVRGFKTASADKINAQLLTDKSYIKKLEKLFPSAVVNGVADKAKLREIIFMDAAARRKINKLSHGEVAKKIAQIKGDLAVEIPLLIESGMAGEFDKIIAVTAPYDVRVNRIIARDSIDADLAKKMIAAQSTDKEREQAADFIIDTNCTFSEVALQIDRIIQAIGIRR